MVDCGYDAAAALARQRISAAQVESIFITHMHADHMLDYGPLLFFAWLQGRTAPIHTFGPAPLARMTDQVLAINSIPLAYYREGMKMGGMPPVRVRETAGSTIIHRDAEVTVSCAEVVHPPVLPSMAFRFDLADRSIVFSGDTARSDALIRLATGADILVHEATDAEKTLALTTPGAIGAGAQINGLGGTTARNFDASAFTRHVYGGHTSVEDAGRVAAAAGVKTLVLSHLSPGSSTAMPDDAWRERAARHFKGRVVVARDGLEL